MAVEHRYWDSDCFLGWLRAETDKESACREVLRAADDGKIMIVTSALTIAEVLNLRGHPKLVADRRADVINFFRNPYIVVRNITRHISESAREYVWDYNVAPKDALHVASAIDAGLNLLNTFDRDLIEFSGKLGNPPLTISQPLFNEPGLPFPVTDENGP